MRITAILMLLMVQSVFADWQLDPEGSHIGFASVKNDLIAENHTFKEIMGAVTQSGMASVVIKLASIETLIPIRNERMQSMLFKTEKHAFASVSSQVPIEAITEMAVGDSQTMKIALLINLHATELKKEVPVKVTRSSADVFDVSSLGPIIVHASQFALSDGVEALRNVAGLQSIDLMVPVTFDLRFVDAGS